MWRSCRIGSSYVQDLILDNQDAIIDLLINKNGMPLLF
jgi:sulfite reductase alpha subunit-like flavoprotein